MIGNSMTEHPVILIREMHDEKEIRCPKLGHQITFSYCRIAENNLPCSHAIQCWEVCLPAREYFRTFLSAEQWDQCFERPPKHKLVSLVELIEQAKRNKRKQD